MLRPTLLDMTRYFQDRFFWKSALIEQYAVSETELEELPRKGWQQIDYIADPTLLFIVTSQLSLVLSITKQSEHEAQPGLPTLWARTVDIQHAQRCPIVLVNESIPGKSSLSVAQQVVVGTHALAFLGKELYRYELAQLGEIGLACWQQIVAGVSPEPRRSPIHSLQENVQYYTELFARAQDAALLLSKHYWHLHEQGAVEPIRVPISITDIPSIFRQTPLLQKKGSLIPATDGLEAALMAISDAHDGAKGWRKHNELPAYLHKRETSVTAVTIRPDHPGDQNLNTDTVGKQLWNRITKYSDIDGDVLLAMLAQVVAVGPDQKGGTWITLQAVLDYRGILPKRHKMNEPDKYRDAGHRPEDMRVIAEAVERLREMHLTVQTWREPRKAGGRRRKVTQESYLLLISDFLLQTMEGQQRPGEKPLQIAWYYRPGESLGIPIGKNTKVAWLLQQTLHYDPYHQKWEKRLSRYFMFQLRINTSFGGTSIKRSIREILQETGLITELDREHPNRNRVHFEQVMRLLQHEGHISDWGEAAYLAAKDRLPSRDYLDAWLAFELDITAAPLLEELTDHLLDLRQRTALASPEQDTQQQSLPRKRGKKGTKQKQ
jgi:hypothetical protein